MKRNSFVFYTDDADCLAYLSDAEFGYLVRQLCRYVSDKTEPVGLSDMAKIGFAFIRVKLDRDMEKYERTCAARREAGRSGGLKRAAVAAEQANACFANQTQAKQADSECDSEYDCDSECDSDRECENESETVCVRECDSARERAESDTHTFTQPTILEIEDYSRRNRLKLDAQRFFDYYTSVGWMIRGSPMRDWKAAARNWSRSESTKPEGKRAYCASKAAIPKGSRGELGEEERQAIRLMLAQAEANSA